MIHAFPSSSLVETISISEQVSNPGKHPYSLPNCTRPILVFLSPRPCLLGGPISVGVVELTIKSVTGADDVGGRGRVVTAENGRGDGD